MSSARDFYKMCKQLESARRLLDSSSTLAERLNQPILSRQIDALHLELQEIQTKVSNLWIDVSDLGPN